MKRSSATGRGSLLLLLLSLLACPPDEVDDGQPPGPGVFAIDDYPLLVKATPLTITGTKPGGFGVQVDGASRVAAGESSSFGGTAKP